jgi:hypothetical protein
MNLPVEVWRNIFEFDPTYHEKFCACLTEVPDAHIYRQQRSRRDGFDTNGPRSTESNDCIPEFTLWLQASDTPYLDIRLNRMLFIYEFTAIDLITTHGVSRFVYNGGTVKDARRDGIDTRLHGWEWWMRVYVGSADPRPSWISCSYHQIHGWLFEVRTGSNFMHAEVSERKAKQLYKAMCACMSGWNRLMTQEYRVDMVKPGTVCTIPDARTRLYRTEF